MLSHSADNTPITSDVTLDTKGLMCPEPVMMLHQAVRKASSGDCIHVLATDPSTTRDIPKFCMHLDHELLQTLVTGEDEHALYEYWIIKR